MILVDTSLWVDHFRSTEPGLVRLLQDGEVLIHPFIIEELACGDLPRCSEVLDLLHALPAAPIATHHEVLGLIETGRLFTTGLGSVDVHLIASAKLADASIWSKDKMLVRHARRLGLAQ